MTGDEAGALSLGGALAIVSVLGLVVARAAAAGALPPNGAVGIRTRNTRRCEAAWQAGHRAAAAPLLLTAVVGLAAAVLTPVAVAVVSATAGWWLAIGAVLVTSVLWFRAARVANRAAAEV